MTTPTMSSNKDRLVAALAVLHGRWTELSPHKRRVIVAMWLRTAVTAVVAWFLICHGRQAVTELWSALRTGTSDQIIGLVVVGLILRLSIWYVSYVLRVGRSEVGVSGHAVRPLVTGSASAMTSEGREHLATQHQRVAGHEAAHATVALALGAIDVHATTIPQGPDVGGRTTAKWQSRTGADAVSQQAWQALVHTLAGHAHDVDSGVFDGGSCSDLDLADKLAFTILSAQGPVPCACTLCAGGEYRGEMTLEGLLLHASNQARHLLAMHAAGHAAIATALNPPAVLDNAALRELMGAACTVRGSRGESSASC